MTSRLFPLREVATERLNQILVVVNMLAVSEAMILGDAAGLDLRKAVAAVEAGAAVGIGRHLTLALAQHPQGSSSGM